MAALRFRSRLVRPEGVGTWTFASIPEATIRTGGWRPRMRVTGTVDGVAFRSSLMPRGAGSLFVVVPQPIREQIGKSAGATVEFALETDTRPVVLPVPKDLASALGPLRPAFDGLAPSQRKIHLQSVASARQPETRARRIARIVAELRARPPR